jgi:hypothetical protein
MQKQNISEAFILTSAAARCKKKQAFSDNREAEENAALNDEYDK